MVIIIQSPIRRLQMVMHAETCKVILLPACVKRRVMLSFGLFIEEYNNVHYCKKRVFIYMLESFLGIIPISWTIPVTSLFP